MIEATSNIMKVLNIHNAGCKLRKETEVGKYALGSVNLEPMQISVRAIVIWFRVILPTEAEVG